MSVPVIARGLAIGAVLLCGACHKTEQHPHHAQRDAAANVVAAESGNSDADDTKLTGTIYVTVDGLDVVDARGATAHVPFGASEATVAAAVKPAVGTAEKIFWAQCGGRKVREYDFSSLTLSFEDGGLVTWKAFGTVRMINGIGEATPREILAETYPDFHKTRDRPSLDMAESFAAGPIRGYMRENIVTSIDAGKPLCVQ